MLGRPLTLLALGGPGVEGRGRDTSRPAGGDHWKPGGLLGIDAAVAAHGVDVSLTQKATVRLSRSRSIRSLAFSASSFRSRTLSSLVSPSRSPRSAWACLTHAPRVES